MIQVKGLKKQYGEFTLNCSLEVKEGCVTGLIGLNGAGKTTVFKGILNLISVDGGQIRIFGKDASEITEQEKGLIGVVLSDSGFNEALTVREIASVMGGLYKSFQKETFLKKCQENGLPLKKKIKEFSTGMQAKLKILTALSHDTRLLILDEPTAGLDVVARDEILDLLRDYMEQDERRAILISSHISKDLENFCDDIYMIHDGAVIIHEDTDTLLNEFGLLKIDAAKYGAIDKSYLLRVKKESFGYSCLTNQKQFYQDNYPDIVIEKGSIDEVISMMIKGEAV